MYMPDGIPSPETVHEHLARILASASFHAGESLRHLLRYTVETTLAGNGAGLKEYTIAVESLGRPSSFDPRQDNIVRVQARKLRERLAAYYAGEGRSETCRIVYHPGSYLPVFTTTREPASPPRTVAVPVRGHYYGKSSMVGCMVVRPAFDRPFISWTGLGRNFKPQYRRRVYRQHIQ